MFERATAFLAKKNTLPLITAIFIISFIVLSVFVYKYTYDYALNRASKNIEDILIEHRAKHRYIEEKQKPVIYELQKKKILGKDFFSPEVLSFTYISRNMHQYLMKEQEKAGRKPYIYKLASINPRNPLNKADKFEKELIKKFNDGEIKSFENIIEIDGEKYFFKAIPIAKNKESCMRCHGNPEAAPKDIVNRYGSDKGFFENVGEIRAIISLAAPLEEPMSDARKYFYIITSVMAVVMLFIYFTIYFFVKQQRKFTTFLTKMFGRYVSKEVMDTLVESPDSVRLGGEKRKVTIMVSDIRGFMPLCEQLAPEQIMTMLNRYFDVMMKICRKYQGTINDIIGDSLLVTFGAPLKIEDHAQAAIACAIEMQNAMALVNKENLRENLPELEMGIGLNTDEVVVGNVGSEERAKFGVVGSGVNMASRIESYAIGGQILISESVYKKIGKVLRIDGQREVLPKGADTSIVIYEVGGISGRYHVALLEKKPDMVTLARQIPLRCTVLSGKHVGKEEVEGYVVRLSKRGAELHLKKRLELLTNLKMNLKDVPDELAAKDFYGKVIEHKEDQEQTQVVQFTALIPEISSYFQAFLQHAQHA
jgi:class 3 adenylate cyclase